MSRMGAEVESFTGQAASAPRINRRGIFSHFAGLLKQHHSPETVSQPGGATAFGPDITRRQFGQIAGSLALLPDHGLSLLNGLKPAEHSPLQAVEPEKPKYELDWQESIRLIAENKAIDLPERAALWDRMLSDLKVVIEGYNPLYKWASELVDLNEEREKNPLHPSIKENARKVYLGNTDPSIVSVEDVILFYAEQKYIKMVNQGLPELLAEIKNRLDKKEFEAIIKSGLLGSFLFREAKMFTPDENPEVLNLRQGTLIVPDDGVKQMSAEGQKKFEEDQAVVRGYIKHYPFLENLPIVIKLISSKYGEVDPERARILGSFRSIFSGPNIIGEIILNMDEPVQPEERNPYPAKLRLYHELGHWGSILTNPALAFFLKPQKALERFAFELQIASNKNWGGTLGIGKDGEMFTGRPQLRNDAKSVKEGSFETGQYVGATEEYPANVILNNVAGVKDAVAQNPFEKFTEQVRENMGVKSFREIVGKDSEQDKPETFVDKLFGNRAQVDLHQYQDRANVIGTKTATPDGPASLDEFLMNYRSILEVKAKAGGAKAQVLLWAFAEHQTDFNNIDGLWDLSETPQDRYIPRPGSPAYIWQNYVENFLPVAILYEAVIGDDQRIKSLVTPQSWKEIVSHFVKAKTVAVAEGWADRSGFAHFLGERLNDRRGCPYLKGWEDLAYRLVTSR